MNQSMTSGDTAMWDTVYPREGSGLGRGGSYR